MHSSSAQRKPHGIASGRIRHDSSHPRRMTFWLACANVRKGAAVNAIRLPKS
jgi:aspartate-semialdehyde dehydrogenase